MKFKDFLTEKKEVHAVMAFGRLNPPTVGHEKLVNKVQDIAKKVGGSAHIVVSHSQDPEKNPLSSEQKLKHAKRAFPGVNVSASDKESPNFLSHATKLYKQGVTHLHMVGGQDRVDEYHKILHKYNGVKAAHGHFNFKHIEVHSAGDRDPDSEGVEGMSASKMREHASKGNFKEFRKGVPSKMSDAHAKDMYNDVRKGMHIKESINEEFEELLIEGVHDQGIFKAVFLAGGPGSGKDYVLSNTLDGHGLTEINSDKALEFLMDKKGLDKRMPENETEARDIVRGKAKTVTELRQRLALQGRNGLIINGTGDDPAKIARIKSKLEDLGYDTSMILVNTNDEVSTQRNLERGQRGGRTVPETIRKEKWDSVQNARTEYAKLFSDRYMEFDNSEDLRQAPPDVVKEKKMELIQLFKNIKDFVAQPPQSPAAQEWVANELQQKDTLKPSKDGAEKIPPHGSSASEEARKMGLQYYGFGRYGKNGKTTHRSVHDKLVQVTDKEPEQPEIPVNASSQ
jgi:predicted ABC-type ATPase